MNFIDIIIIVLMLIFGIKGYLKGFIHELFSILIIVISLIGAILLYRSLAFVLGKYIENKDLTLLLSFLSIFLFIAILLIIIRNTITELIDNLNFKDFDCLLGVVFGLFKGLIICGIVFIFLKNHPVLGIGRYINGSLIFPFIDKFFTLIISVLPTNLLVPLKKILVH